MPDLRSGRRPPTVPGYVVEELLGRGGSGEVWRARPRAGGPAVAVKVLVRGDPARQAREAALLGELDHPHLVHLHEVVRHGPRGGPEQVALVLDLLAGGSLADLLARRGRLRPGEVVTTVAPVAAALAHAHDRGVVHGDLSPGNIVFTAEGRPVLTDLGVARVLGDAARAEVTPAYVDPTVARGGAPGPASDVFGVAAAAFHALTGIAPWNAAGPAETLQVAAVGELPDLALLAPDAPPELVAVVSRGLAADPHERGSAAAFALDLRHACRPEPVRMPVAGVPDTALGETGRGPRTELTHQVPGRRPRAVHAAPVPRRRRPWARGPAGPGDAAGGVPATVGPRRRRVLLHLDDRPGLGPVVRTAARRLAAVAAVIAVLTGAVWLGGRWGRAQDDVGRVATAVAGAEAPATGTAADTVPPPQPSPEPPPSAGTGSSAVPPPAGPPVVAPEPTPPAGPSTTDAPEPPPGDGPAVDVTQQTPAGTDLAGWRDLVQSLYDRRAAAFAEGRPELLAQVYAAGSDLGTRDREEVATLVSGARQVRGFAPTVLRVDGVTIDGDRARIALVDSFADYRVVPAGDPAATGELVSGRAEAGVAMELVRTVSGWRLDTARLVL